MKNLIKKILRESDDLDWIREIPSIYDHIQPGTIFYCEDCQIRVFIGLLKIIEQKYPDARWRNYSKPTEYIPKPFSGMRVLGFNSDGIIWWDISLKDDDESDHRVVDISQYESLLLSI